MSHGPGHVQQEILDLIDSDPDGAWLTSQICTRVYDIEPEQVEKRHRVAVIRALTRMKLPKGWHISQQGGPPNEKCLFNRYSIKSRTKAVAAWRGVSPEVVRRESVRLRG
jgi:hypothetical protein